MAQNSGAPVTHTAPNPLIAEFPHRHGAIPFDQIRTEHFMPALDHVIAKADQQVEEIAASPDAPTFANTLVPLEELWSLVGRMVNVYSWLSSGHGDDELRDLAREIWPKLADYTNRFYGHPGIYERVRQIHDARETLGLDPDETRVVEVVYRTFVRNGACLAPEGKEHLAAIDREASALEAEFAQNALKDLNRFYYHTEDEDELRGLPAGAVERAAAEARARGQAAGWGFTLQEPSVTPVLLNADRRSFRERVYRAQGRVGLGGEYDNVPVLKRTAVLRHERARLLGYTDHAHYVLEERMAKNPATVSVFLDRYREVAVPLAREEMGELRGLARTRDGVEDLRHWDVGYYREKLKKERFDFDRASLRPYFKVEKVVEGIMAIARRLYGLRFHRVDDLPVYHPDVEVYEVRDSTENPVGLIYLDLFARPSKDEGAWQGTLRAGGMQGGVHRRPVVAVAANLTPSIADSPSLLALDEVKTIFHEMGHALHALHDRPRFPSLGCSDVSWDFVELPSLIMENWATAPEALALFAHHHQTGEPIPEDLMERVREAERFHGGCSLTRSLSYELIDMAWHTGDPGDIEDVEQFEASITAEVRCLPPLEKDLISPAFSHIFAGGYHAGYYSYRWAETLEADAFEYFKEKGVFDSEVAMKFRDHVLSQGNREHPAILYERFRGRGPDPDALMRKFGVGESG